VTGYLTLGIDTQTNNASAGYQKYATDKYGDYTAVLNAFSSTPLTSFIDSGSSILFFPWPPPNNKSASSQMPDCGGGLTGFYCPTSTTSFSAQTIGSSGTATSCVDFSVANAKTLLSGSNLVFSNIAGASGSNISSDLDFGLPFFLGKRVFVGIDKTTSTLGTGPYWAY
jgi:hypothetical protein